MEKIANVGPKGTNFQRGIQAASDCSLPAHGAAAVARSHYCSHSTYQCGIQGILIKLELLSLMRPVKLQFESVSVIDSFVTWCNLRLNVSGAKRARGEFRSNIFTHLCSTKIFSYLYDQHKPFLHSWGSNNNYCRVGVVNGWWTSGVPPPTVRFKRRLEAKSEKTQYIFVIMKQSVIIW